MKFMELGFRPDTFYTVESVRSVSSDLLNDLIIQVKSTKYLLHKFPMLSKCLRLKNLVSSQETETSQEQQVIQLVDFPGETEAFELCAKFCYGITITLCAHNVVAVRCAAEYLGMTEEVELGETENLVQRLELFLTSCVFKSWRDSFVTLQTTKVLPLWSEDLGITNRCIEAIANGVSVSPGEDFSTQLETGLLRNRSRIRRDEILCNGGGSKAENLRWWGEDLAELGLDLYRRTMVAIKSSNRKISRRLIGNALRIYASKWLPSIEESSADSNLVLESVISLLPEEKSSVPCSFLLQLLKMANVMNISPSSKMELAIKAGNQLDKATVSELLIPLSDKSGMLYDVDVVAIMVKQFLSHISPEIRPTRTRTEHRRSRSEENINLEEIQEIRGSLSTSSSPPLLGKVAKLVDSYLQEIARDVNLTVSKFVELAESIPDVSRICHDDLYKAIDIYLQVHEKIEKCERKRLCRILDCKKLSVEASKKAAQNELLPLRVIVQILFVEQARATIATTTNNITTNETAVLKRSFTTRREEGIEEERDETKPSGGFLQSTPSRFMALCAIPRQPKKMLCKLLSISRSLSQRI
ncbi:BTB/POZ domain-containing protein At3g26490 [Arabidopsis lyrata subsp. lyrata]|uniref:BTB/POZ domain-containing protein At3g26490 n=1 Tax=Arabidopsis lyrata subsp. lyrata TaxID=81972 RepID=UPI000A29D8D5|nr:BTB/POZ domain-containing protein At3g26490 [Arabidopsis lyrata subsp. lyrata]|eukprot:XP_020882407.1 BTB/POZ domain-containing protein At3g26490 [Arabidopsis lyrata subsp. lyrata]